jgi:hypothetical protein
MMMFVHCLLQIYLTIGDKMRLADLEFKIGRKIYLSARLRPLGRQHTATRRRSPTVLGW